MTHDDAVAWAARRTVHWNAHDAAALTADHASDGTVDTTLAGVVRGRVAIDLVYRSWFEAFPDLQFETNPPFLDAHRIALFWTIHGTHQGSFLGLAPTDRRLRIHGAFLYDMVNGEIVYERRIVDFTGVIADVFGDHSNKTEA